MTNSDTVLVVEDDESFRKFVTENLLVRKFRVLEAADAENGLIQVRDEPPSMMLVDIKLPGMSGWDFLGAIRDDPDLTKIPVVVMTASASEDDAQNMGYSNIRHVLIKPFGVNQLMEAVEMALGPAND